MYNTQLLTQEEMCDQILAKLADEKAILEARRTQEEISLEQETPLATSIPQEIEALQVRYDALKAANDAMPEGPAKEKDKAEVNIAENRLITMKARNLLHGQVATVFKSLDLLMIDKMIEAHDLVAAEVTARKAVLQATG